MYRHLRCVALLAAAFAVSHALAGTHKCPDEKGRITYSDRPCMQAAAPAAAAKAQPVPNKVGAGGKLTEPAVDKLLRYAMELGNRNDYETQCALAARDLAFKVVDHSISPALVLQGGRKEICARQREAIQNLTAANLRAVYQVGKIAINLSADGSEATASYETVVTLSGQGRGSLSQRCKREDVLGLYTGEILYRRVNAVCQALA
jgi:hypothetical protein